MKTILGIFDCYCDTQENFICNIMTEEGSNNTPQYNSNHYYLIRFSYFVSTGIR